ncbi:ABC transporter permease (plasmid) [Mycolicibacterium vanbaalenii]|uniref:ABC transporter permease n=1 Tax=Mycolicibacterium TaxID=1866885 RepID=UPI0021F3930B|nr:MULTISPECIES: ABC transporter permease [Mycolicibacterium]MCV7153581.1 ABC transporter permease [Mycolicibacterium pyrenivorans]WND60346.1 ABC transporter permease [Mycolicibacterium vanbaalenii]
MTTAAHEQWRPTLLLTRSFITDYVRNPVNLIMLVLVPGVFVLVAAGSIADAMELLRGSPGMATQIATAGWAAGFLSGLAMYFQVRSAHAADRRMLLAGVSSARLLAARAGTGLLMAGLVTTVALIALAVRTGIDNPGRVIAGTLMFALIYLAIGALIGVAVSNPVNGAVVILLVWMIDVFVGPGGSGGDYAFTRWFPTHFVTLWMVGTPSRHGGQLGDLGISLVWVVGALVVAGAVVAAGSRTARRHRRSAGQLLTALRFGLVDLRRNPVLLVLLVLVPVLFVLLAKATTPARPLVVAVTESGSTSNQAFWFPDVHAGAMAPIGIGALAALVGMFVVVDAAGGDRRLRLAGYRTSVVLSARLGVVAAATIVITVATLAVTATVFNPKQWVAFAAVNLLVAATYAMIGVIIGPLLGKVAGVFVAFLIPFLDLGIIQSPMLRPEPEQWANLLPGYGWTKVLFDTGLTAHFDQTGPLLAALAWLSGLLLVASLVLARSRRQGLNRVAG